MNSCKKNRAEIYNLQGGVHKGGSGRSERIPCQDHAGLCTLRGEGT